MTNHFIWVTGTDAIPIARSEKKSRKLVDEHFKLVSKPVRCVG